ncbi:MAG: hypothetical protein L0207_02165 [Chlamydiae bacterium]|nr:hypothetical protein [Chlamydiota bacterium]
MNIRGAFDNYLVGLIEHTIPRATTPFKLALGIGANLAVFGGLTAARHPKFDKITSIGRDINSLYTNWNKFILLLETKKTGPIEATKTCAPPIIYSITCLFVGLMSPFTVSSCVSVISLYQCLNAVSHKTLNEMAKNEQKKSKQDGIKREEHSQGTVDEQIKNPEQRNEQQTLKKITRKDIRDIFQTVKQVVTLIDIFKIFHACICLLSLHTKNRKIIYTYVCVEAMASTVEFVSDLSNPERNSNLNKLWNLIRLGGGIWAVGHHFIVRDQQLASLVDEITK